MRAWFHVIARQRSSELFMLNVLLVTLGLAALTELAGLSLALGAFLAGMLIAETEYRYQVEEDIKPFRDVLLGLFFVTVGMALDLSVVAQHWAAVLLLLVAPVVVKLLLIVGLSRAFGAALSTALRTGFYLAQAGEFALVMLALMLRNKIVPANVAQVVLAAMVLSMLSAPLLIHFAERIVRRLTANDWLARAAQLTQIAATTMARRDHVLICGFGAQRPESRAPAREGGHRVHRARRRPGARARSGGRGRQRGVRRCGTQGGAAGRWVDEGARVGDHVRGHADRPEDSASCAAASAGSAGDRAHHRRQRDRALAKCAASCHAEVVPETPRSGSLTLSVALLLLSWLGVPLARVLARIRAIREERYSLFRGFFHGISDAADAADNLQPRLHSVLLPERARAIGRALPDIGLPDRDGEITGVRRRGARSRRPGADWRFEVGADVVVLLRRPE